MTAEVEHTLASAGDAIPAEADFLFHLYRGSELLNDHRLLEAQSEFEYALTLEPSDARTQGLLAVVYFRRGFYARSIATYRTLLKDRPDDPSLRLNLALCYLKTGETHGARVELETLVMENVDDLRAWGYLAVTLERLGFIDQAREAFERAGHSELARRLAERGALSSLPPEAGGRADTHSRRPPAPSAPFEELDGGELSIELVAVDRTRAEALRDSVMPPMAVPPQRAPRLDTLGWEAQPRAAGSRQGWLEAPPLTNFIEDARVQRAGDAHGVTVLGTRLARVELDATHSARGFAFRLESLRSYAGTIDAEILARQMRAEAVPTNGTPGETFGGIGTPFASMKGPGQLILGPRPAQRIVAFVLHEQIVFFREDVMLGFDLSLPYENGRLGWGSGPSEGTPLVQLRGTGTVLLELGADVLALDVKPGGISVRKDVVVGWAGRLLPRALSGDEAPGGQRGLVAFSGEGVVLVTGK